MMRAKSFATVLLGTLLVAFGAASGTKPFPTVNPAKLEKSDPLWQHAWFEVARVPLAPTTPMPELRRGDPTQKVVALTFDDGPHGAATLRLLDILRMENVKATFFVVGKMAKKRPELVREIVREGHEIANHTFSHATLTRITPEEVRADYEACNNVLEEITGTRPTYCRPPGGDSDPAVVRAAASLGMTSVFWTTDPGDYYSPGTDKIMSRTLNELKPGGIILLHDGIEQTLDQLPAILETIKARGYKIVTVGELAQMKVESDQRRQYAKKLNANGPQTRLPVKDSFVLRAQKR